MSGSNFFSMGPKPPPESERKITVKNLTYGMTDEQLAERAKGAAQAAFTIMTGPGTADAIAQGFIDGITRMLDHAAYEAFAKGSRQGYADPIRDGLVIDGEAEEIHVVYPALPAPEEKP